MRPTGRIGSIRSPTAGNLLVRREAECSLCQSRRTQRCSIEKRWPLHFGTRSIRNQLQQEVVDGRTARHTNPLGSVLPAQSHCSLSTAPGNSFEHRAGDMRA